MSKKTDSRGFGVRAWLAMVSAAIIVAVVLIGFVPLSHPVLTRAFLAAGTKAGFSVCRAKSVTITLWRGCRIDDLFAEKPDKAGNALRIETPLVIVNYRILPLFKQRFSVKEIRVIKPVVTWSLAEKSAEPGLRRKGSRTAAASLVALPAFSVSIDRVSIEHAQLAVVKGKRRFVTADDFNGSIQINLDANQSSSGTYSAGQITLDDRWVCQKVSAQISLDRNLVNIKSCHGSLLGGIFDLSGGYSLNDNRIELAKVAINQLDLAQFYDATDVNKGELTGKASLQLAIRGCAPVLDSMAAEGSFTLTDVHASKLPFQNTLALIMVLPQLSDITFKKIVGPVKISNGRILTNATEGTGNICDITASGFTTYLGEMDQKVSIILSTEFTARLGDIVRNSLLVEPDKRSSFKCTIRGSFSHPKIEIDKRIVSRAANNVFQEISKGFKGWFK